MNELNVILKEATEEELIAILDFIEKEKTAQIIAEEIFKAGKDSDPRLITQIVREVFGELIYKYASYHYNEILDISHGTTPLYCFVGFIIIQKDQWHRNR